MFSSPKYFVAPHSYGCLGASTQKNAWLCSLFPENSKVGQQLLCRLKLQVPQCTISAQFFRGRVGFGFHGVTVRDIE